MQRLHIYNIVIYYEYKQKVELQNVIHVYVRSNTTYLFFLLRPPNDIT